MTVQYYTKQVYGNTLMYLVESEATKVILRLIEQKTISERQMDMFKVLGVTFERVFEPESK